MNAYYMLQNIRDHVGEATASHWDDVDLLAKINVAHRSRAMEVGLSLGDWLVTSTTVTPSSAGVITLPSDCVKPVYLEDADENPISFSGTVRERRLTRVSGVALEVGITDAYMQKGQIILNTGAAWSGDCTLWYQRRVPDLAAGTASAGGATSITLLSTNRPSQLNDYYNGSYVEVVSGTGAKTRTTISDYAGSTYIATTAAGTFGNDSVYGTCSELPEEVMPVVELDATLLALAKPSSAIDSKYFEYFRSLRRDAQKTFRDWVETQASESIYTRITELD